MKVSTALLAAASAASASPIVNETWYAFDSHAADATSVITARNGYADIAVSTHNTHRQKHSAPPMSWNADLAGYAAAVASSCVFAHNLGPGGGGYGQNLAVSGSSADITSADPNTFLTQAITNIWYDGELALYPGYGQPTPDMSNFSKWGHFSQLVWVASTEVGCATHYCPAGTIFPALNSWYTVCDYKAAGNVASQYGKNVLPPQGM
ncbi:SCP-like extracellular protein [Sporothrix schenckii 1099-18]|uniref:SCP-like extracellular protein n=1 Tax=Sporothrix schenckii 1099-18 TaxID=1397361 RepID=A0A0F2MIZ9_SPOSC|nr:SCP-like extracellular protein [Sporothrix schenckii 1099-18]KJR89029.1 SCP-like extracellular protein [Sporothrix schenckii 1099-18]